MLIYRFHVTDNYDLIPYKLQGHHFARDRKMGMHKDKTTASGIKHQ